jgi:hypothetical protein
MILFSIVKELNLLLIILVITENNVGKSQGDIGDDVSVKLSDLEDVYKNILKSAIREIRINKLV